MHYICAQENKCTKWVHVKMINVYMTKEETLIKLMDIHYFRYKPWKIYYSLALFYLHGFGLTASVREILPLKKAEI